MMKGSSRLDDAPATVTSPLTRPISVDSIKAAGQHMDVTLDADEATSLAKFLGLASIERLKARYKVTRNGDHAAIKGTLEAEVHQICVVSLESFPVKVREDVAMKFAPDSEIEKMEARLLAQSEDSSIDLGNIIDADNFPEPILDGRIDLGAATTEFLSLALPPYPRRPGVVFAESENAGERLSPFAVLARLKQDKQP